MERMLLLTKNVGVRNRSTSSASVRLRFLLLSLPSQRPQQSMCAFVLRDVCKVVDVRPFSPSTFGFMTSARIASPCFTRPSFELGHSLRAPQASAKRVRLSCSLKSRVLSSIHHDVLNVALSTPHLSSSPSQSQRLAPRVVWQLHL